ncbi:MAG: hypothetical protein JWM55_1630 [Acidimicrobiaceae bacterium]|nr:hypothetical protein [Acidimicrobiaceae bacterium]
MSPAPGGGNLEEVRGGGISHRGPSSIGYTPAAAVGFEIVPEAVRSQLRAMGIIGVSQLCASCEELGVRRRPDGTHYQSGEAWWGDATRAVLMTLSREMVQRGGRQFSPGGAWRVSGMVHHLGDVGGPEKSTWQYDPAASTGKSDSPPVKTNDPLDLLPPDVAAPVRGGSSDVWLETSSSSATEYLTAIRVLANKVLQLEANRTARSKAALLRAAWTLTTLEAPITKSVPFAFTIDGQTLASGARNVLGGTPPGVPRLPGG